MASILRYPAVAALIFSVLGSAIETLPSQTVVGGGGGYGIPLAAPGPTEAPGRELVRMRFEKRSVTNICTEWTIPGGFGQPQCYYSETCLFTSDANGNLWEGCGETSINYDWITACYGWPQTQTGSEPVSETWCASTAPYCGYFGFVFDISSTYYNYGCSTISYALFVDLIDTTKPAGLPGNSGTTVFVTVSQTSASAPVTTSSSSASSTATNSVIGSHSSSKAPIGAIVGGVIGGIALIAFIAFLVWFILRKKRQDAAATTVQQQQDAAAQYQPQRINEIGGNMVYKTPMTTAYTPIPQNPPPNQTYYPEKPVVNPNIQQVPPQLQPQSAYAESPNAALATPSPGSPPPVYTQPQPQPQQSQSPPSTLAPNSPPQGYTELEHPRNSYIQPPPPVSPVIPVSIPDRNELENTGRASYIPGAPPNVSEMSGNSAASGGVNRRSVNPGQGGGGFDMSGAPLGEDYIGHELE